MSNEAREKKRLRNKSSASNDVRSLPEAKADRQTVPPRAPKKRPSPRSSPLRAPRFNVGAWFKGRRIEMGALFIALLSSGFFVLQARHFEGRYAKAREVEWWLPFWESLESLELTLYDRRVTIRGPRIPNSINQIAIVGLDQVSLDVFQQWPFPREYHAELIRRLKKAGAKVIVLDFNFKDKQNIESDAALAAAMAEAGNVIIGSSSTLDINFKDAKALNLLASPLTQTSYDNWYYANRVEVDADPRKKKAYETFKELGIDEQTPDIALTYVTQDLDGAVRQYPFRGEFNDRSINIGSMAALAAATRRNLLDSRNNAAYELALAQGIWPTLRGAARRVPLQINLPPTPTSPVFFTTPIYWWGPPGTFPTYPYSAVKGLWEVNAKGQRVFSGYNETAMRARFKDRIVFVGATAHILKDLFPIPLLDRQTDLNEIEIPGVEIHATVTAMLLDGAYVRTAAPHITVIMIFGLTILGCLWTVFLRGWVNDLTSLMQKKASKIGLGWWLHSWLWFGVYAALISLPLVLFWQGAKWVFTSRDLWINVTYPGVSLGVSSALVLVMLFSAETVERRKTIAQLGSYMSPEVRDEILAQSENEFVRPRRLTATMLFTDLEGFTSYSETHSPEEVVRALNDYFDRMVPIVNAHGGNVDKYIGDSIMAFYGFPVPRYDHAAQALLCAVALQEECARFREETGVDFYMRIGVHTGEMIAGSIGAQQMSHFNYTALGDSVNLASRLEGKNKEFGSWIMCSAATYEAAGGIVEAEHTSASIKGKSQDVEVFIVHGLKGEPEQDKHWGKPLPSPTAGAMTAGEDSSSGTELKALPAASRSLKEGKT